MVELQEGPGRTVAGLFPPQSPGPPELHMGRSGPQEKGPLNWKLGLWKDSLPSGSSGTTWVLEVLPREPQRVGRHQRRVGQQHHRQGSHTCTGSEGDPRRTQGVISSQSPRVRAPQMGPGRWSTVRSWGFILKARGSHGSAEPEKRPLWLLCGIVVRGAVGAQC